ncbi:MAG TPA: lipoxygenase family protein, partial [Polyangium sp.]|nr:lipoxygenase family protein [Polyangium sp.]
MTTQKTLPQHANAEQLAQRARDLAWAQTLYTWAHSYTYTYQDKQFVLQPIAVLAVDKEHPLPDSQQINLVQILDIIDVGISLLSNLVVNITNLLGVGAVEEDPPPPASFMRPESPGSELFGAIAAFRSKVEHAVADVVHDLDEIVHDVAGAEKLAKNMRTYRAELDALERDIHDAIARGKPSPATNASFASRLGDIFKRIVESLLEAQLSKAGLFGPAQAMSDYARQFQSIVVPNVVSVAMSDASFARMRIAGPNPVVIRKIDALPSNFPVESARFEALTGQALEAALASDRVYLVDYKVLDVMTGGTYPAGQKYVAPGFALFALGENRRKLEPVAIQCGQTPGHATPVFYRDDGESWDLAKLHIQAADGNYHELISHLGLTHLLIEAFVVATHRNLSQQHPLFTLLLPHFQGTIFINNSALTSLINPGGTVDRLLAGTIESDWTVTANALSALDFNAHMLPNELAGRGVANPKTFPDYPYRDDALLLWGAIESWVRDYLAIYYNDDAAIVHDLELQAWYRDLVSSQGGCIQGFGETAADGQKGIFTYAYLTQVVTMLIFTGSVQHAAVNFPQKEIMSYTPAMPLAMYAPPPTRVGGPESSSTTVANLPPLQMSFLQVVVGQLLGGVYFTRLGDYDRHSKEPW